MRSNLNHRRHNPAVGLVGSFLALLACSTLANPLGQLVATSTPTPSATPVPSATPLPTPTPEPLECDDPLGCVEVGPGERINLGAMLALSGRASLLGEDSLGAIQVALAERPEILGHGIDIVTADTKCSADGGELAAQQILQEPSLVAIVGTSCSSEAFAAMPAISEAGLLMCSPSNTNPGLTSPEIWLPGYFRVSHNDLMQGRLAAEFLSREFGVRRAATITDNSPFSNGLVEAFEEAFEQLGGDVIANGFIGVGNTDYRVLLGTLAAQGVDAIYFPIFEPEGDYIIAQAAAFEELNETVLMSADGLLADTFPENSGPNVVGVFVTGPYVSGPAYEAFLDLWKLHIGGVPPSGFHAHAFDCTNLILNAIEQVAVASSDGSLSIGRQALRDAFHSVVDFPGVTGLLTCGPEGDCASFEALAVFQITQRELNGNWPPPMFWQLPPR
ncbi:MAG: branched-chain amino acid ABC transporter substrate-binding protein [Anaerolineae bacterium]|nr:MAG: branched-chain amino acid ABC transporter substrate-binding protein [Anaerolineae bacterium]